MKKIIAWLCLVVLLSVMVLTAVSCHDEGGNGPSQTTESVTKNELLSHIPEIDFDGYKFKVLSRAGEAYTREIFDDGSSVENINSAVFRRNSIIYDTYGVEIVLLTVDSPDEAAHTDEIRRSVQANDMAYDFALTHSLSGCELAAEGFLYNWNTLPYLDYEQEWWNTDIIDALSVGDSLYVASNDMTLHSMEYAWGMVYNTDLATDLGLTHDVVEMVRNKEWTLDNVSKITIPIAHDLNGDSAMTDEDRYGFGYNWWGATIAMMYGADQPVTTRDSEGYPMLSFNTEKTISVIEKLFALTYTNDSCMSAHSMGQVYPAFEDDRILLMAIVMCELEGFRDMKSDFLILPIPMYDENQDRYQSLVDGHANIMCIPAYIDNPNLHGVVLEALAALSHELVLPEYYDKILMYKHARDDDSREMLGIIMDGRTYDFGYLYDLGGMAFITYQLISSRSMNFSSAYAAKETTAVSKLMTLLDAFGALE